MMPLIEKNKIEELNRRLDIRDYIAGCRSDKAQQTLECPFCGQKKFKVDSRKGKNFAYCFSCQKSLSPIQAYMYVRKMADSDFVEAVKTLAAEVNLDLQLPEKKKISGKKSAKDAAASKPEPVKAVAVEESPFYREQLAASGLTPEDTLAEVIVDDQRVSVCPFSSGSYDTQFWKLDEYGHDMLIHYYDLEGRPLMYRPKGGRTSRPYVRVRWMIPEAHTNPDGKPMKYQTPPGAKCRVYVPERIRRMYRNSAIIDTLFVQEGEKKAEKACKHGIPSIAIQGIFNIGNSSEGLISEIQSLTRRCKIKNIVLLMDSDWNQLSSNLVIGDRADARPNLFSKAVIKFRDYIRTLHNAQLSVDIWWGHINVLESGEKGVDDLLSGSLAGNEQEFADEVSRVMNSHDGIGRYVNIHKISSLSDMQIRDFWTLNDYKAFYALHRKRLEQLGNFKIGRIRYAAEGAELKQISGFGGGEDIYSVIEKKDGEKTVEFNMTECMSFLNANGYYLMRLGEDPSSEYEFVHAEDGIYELTIATDIRKFVLEYIKTNCNTQYVVEAFMKKLQNWLSDKRLEFLASHDEPYVAPEKGTHRSYYCNGAVVVTAESITAGAPVEAVWRRQILRRRFSRVPVLADIRHEHDRFYIDYSPNAQACHMLTYIINTSNNWYSHDNPRELTPEEDREWTQHIVNKITAMGYLICEYKYSSDHGVVVAQDHRMSEVGQNQGGTGKSIFGDAIGKICSQAFIIGSQASSSDQFLFSTVNKWTRNIFIDDVRTNFNFKDFFSYVTGPMVVNPKHGDRFELPVDRSPRIFITTNHTINGANEDAVKRRINYIKTSTWYNPEHTPYSDFGCQLFADWDEFQWQLFDNFMMECVMFYLRSVENNWGGPGRGVVKPPIRNIELRSLRQGMSELFFQWAEEYFDPTGPNINERRNRREMFNSVLDFATGTANHGISNSNFRKRLEYYCRFKGYDLNVTKPEKNSGLPYNEWKPQNPDKIYVGKDDKTNGQEFYTVYSPEKEKQMKPF